MSPLPCPFCGFSGIEFPENGDAVWCASCHALGPSNRNSEEATRLWNRRIYEPTPEPKQPATDLKIRALEAISSLTQALTRYEENCDSIAMFEEFHPPSVGLEIKKLGEIGLSLAEMVKREISDKPTNQ